MCESFFAKLECELLERRRFASQAEAKMACFSFIEGWYNAVRLHSALGYRSPMAYEAAREVAIAEPRNQTPHHSTRAGQLQLYERRDEAFETKMADVLCVYREVAVLRESPDEGRVAIISYDEKPGTRQSAPPRRL